MFYTFKAYLIRLYSQNYLYWDLGVDSLIFEHICYSLMFTAFVYLNGFVMVDFSYGCLISILFLIGKQTLTIAYAEGPGGPVNTIIVS